MTRHICDGHEYRVITPFNDNERELINNYGTAVAQCQLDPAEEYWILTAGDHYIGRLWCNGRDDKQGLHEWIVYAYASWAIDGEEE